MHIISISILRICEVHVALWWQSVSRILCNVLLTESDPYYYYEQGNYCCMTKRKIFKNGSEIFFNNTVHLSKYVDLLWLQGSMVKLYNYYLLKTTWDLLKKTTFLPKLPYVSEFCRVWTLMLFSGWWVWWVGRITSKNF